MIERNYIESCKKNNLWKQNYLIEKDHGEVQTLETGKVHEERMSDEVH